MVQHPSRTNEQERTTVISSNGNYENPFADDSGPGVSVDQNTGVRMASFGGRSSSSSQGANQDVKCVVDVTDSRWTPQYMRDPNDVTPLDLRAVPPLSETLTNIGSDLKARVKASSGIFGSCELLKTASDDEIVVSRPRSKIC